MRVSQNHATHSHNQTRYNEYKKNIIGQLKEDDNDDGDGDYEAETTPRRERPRDSNRYARRDEGKQQISKKRQ